MDSAYAPYRPAFVIDKDGNFIIDYSVFDAKRAGFDKVVFIIKEAIAADFKATIGARVEKHIAVEYAYQELSDIPEGYAVPEGRIKPWGTTHAVRSTREIVKEPYGVINADDFYGRNTYEKLAAHLSKLEKGELGGDGVCHCCAVGFKVNKTLTDKGGCSRGICKVDGNGMLLDLVETHKIEKLGDNAQYPDANGNMVYLDGETVADKLDEMIAILRTMGCEVPSPNITLSFITLIFIPCFGITDQGLFDVREFKIIDPIISLG